MQLKTELQDLLFMSNDELQAIYDEFTKPLVNALRDRLDWKEFNELESAVNHAVWEACELGFKVGIEFAQNPAAFVFESDLSGDK